MGVFGQRSGVSSRAETSGSGEDQSSPTPDDRIDKMRDSWSVHTDSREAGLARPIDLDATIAAAQGGDEMAFCQLFRALQPAIIRYLRVLVGSDAEDVASEVWLQIARDYPSFSGSWDGFRGWAVTIARHRAIDHLRRQKRRSEVAVPIEQLLDLPASGDTEREAVDAIATEVAVALIAKLPREQAEAIMLRVVVGLDATTSGAILGRRPGAVRTAAHRGLRKLDQWFGDDLDRLFGGVTRIRRHHQ